MKKKKKEEENEKEEEEEKKKDRIFKPLLRLQLSTPQAKIQAKGSLISLTFCEH